MTTLDPELEAMNKVDEALKGLKTAERVRVLDWAASKYLATGIPRRSTTGVLQSATGSNQPPVSTIPPQGKEIPGIARLDDNGNLIITARDLKAKSTNDAAVRLVHIAVEAYRRLTGNKTTPSKEIINPILQKWRAYTANTRHVIAAHKGIHLDKGQYSLDQYSQRDADKYITEILDESVPGDWNPSTRGTKAHKKKSDGSNPTAKKK